MEEWFLILISLYDAVLALINHFWGSVPHVRSMLMEIKHNVICFLDNWVVRFALLALGLWVGHPQSNKH